MFNKQRRTIAILDALLPNRLVHLKRYRIRNDFPGHVNDGDGSIQRVSHIFQHGCDPFSAHDRIEHLNINVLQFVVGYEQVLTKDVEFTGKKIAVIGGGLTGLETAEYLAAKGNEVTVIEMAPAVGTAMYRSVTAAVVGNIEKDGGHIMTSHMFKGVKDGAVVVNSLATGYDLDVPADVCVIAMGVHPDETIADAFEAAFDRVAVVGDTADPGNIADATNSGYAKAFVF